ncbi:MAG: DNA topoisomerase (ATP-hydrolyzing) subunit A [Clostridia bacterium]|nr:DNA topoisomerase (ATP-hydrolyzing) subunit A [Clostridia bacterium]
MTNPPIDQRITDTLEKNYMPYAMSVIISRAIPEIDGFKPSHRKLLYTMYKMGLLTGAKTKSANVVGQTMKLNPHGDAAIYETMVRLTTGNEALLHPFVDSKGNFGKHFSSYMAYAAPRYTEVKLDGICAELFGEIDKDTVDFVDNYDGTMQEPTMLPVTFPSVLVSPNQGIAVGMASNICSFNLTELCETTVQYLKNENCNLRETLPAPDFSTGGYVIVNAAEMDKIYETGRGSFRLRAKYVYDKQNNCIEIKEIPYTTKTEVIIDRVAELIKGNKIREITDIRDETDLSGLKITIDLKRGTDADKLMKKLYKMTSLEDSFSCNFNILINGSPRVMGVREILQQWTLFRMECIRRRIRFDIQNKSDKLHLLLGLKMILLDIDKAIRIVRETEADELVVPNLMEGFEIDRLQAEFVAEIKLRNLNKQYIIKRTAETDALADEIQNLKATLESEKAIKKLVIESLQKIAKKYGKERKTQIIAGEDVEPCTESDEVEDYNVKIFFTRDNYLKKISLVSLRSASEQKLKEDDVILTQFDASNRWDVLLFSNMQNVYKLRLCEVQDCKASALGEFLPNLLGLSAEERIVYAVPTDKYTGYMLFGFENGKIAKTEMASYATKLNRKKLQNAYGGASPLVSILFIEEDTEITLFSTSGKILTFPTAAIQPKSTRGTQGVQVMKMRKGHTLSAMQLTTEETAQYKSRNIPSGGYYPATEEETDDGQLSLF